MAATIKGIKIEFGAETRALDKALADVNAKASSLQKELTGVNKLLKLDPSNTEMVAQKQKLLKEAIENTREKLDRLRAAQAEVQAQFDRGEITQEQYRAFQREIAKTEGELKKLEAAGKASAAEIGESVRAASDKMKSVGQTLTTHVTLPILAAGAAAVALWQDIDAAIDDIRIGTGATGKALKELEEDFRSIARTTPSDLGDISTAITNLNIRLKLTGKPLQDLATQFLNLSRLTKTDLKQNITDITRLFGDWGIKAKDQARALDLLFIATQKTGVGINELAAQAVAFGAPMRELGFSFTETIALLGKFGQEGVNVELVMGGLKKGLAKLAKEGESPRDVILGLEQAISQAGLTAENKQKVFELFGARAGIDMAKAMEEGRFKLSELLIAIEGSPESINKAAEATDGWEERLKVLWNRIKMDLAPTLDELIDDLEKSLLPVLEKLTVKVGEMIKIFTGLPPELQSLIITATTLAVILGPLLSVISSLITILSNVWTWVVLLGVWLGLLLARINEHVNKLPVWGRMLIDLTNPIVGITRNLGNFAATVVDAWMATKSFLGTIKMVALETLKSYAGSIKDVIGLLEKIAKRWPVVMDLPVFDWFLDKLKDLYAWLKKVAKTWELKILSGGSGTPKKYQHGGYVDAPRGVAVPAILHGGEYVVPAHHVSAWKQRAQAPQIVPKTNRQVIILQVDGRTLAEVINPYFGLVGE